MTTHELYINDKLIDIDKDVNIYPLYQSPVFIDLQSIISNVSNNVSLPLTPNNARVINMYHLADRSDSINSIGTFPRKWHKIRYLRNGVSVCEEGRGVIVGIENNRINFAFSWGNVENFEKLQNKNLNDLTFTDAVVWGGSTSYVTDVNADYGFFNICFGAGVDINKIKYQHPCVSTNFIIKKIAEENGITINNKIGNRYLTDNFIIPCLNKFGDSRNTEIPNNKFECTTPVLAGSGLHPAGSYNDPLNIWDVDNNRFQFRGITKVRISISGFTIKYKYNTYKPTVELSIGKHFTQEIAEENHNPRSKYVICIFDPVSINIDTIEQETLKISIAYGGVDGEIEFIEYPPVITIISFMKECEYREFGNAYFPLAVNLPEIKQLDFLRAIFQMNGLFAFSRSLNTIDLISINDIIDKIPSAYDWTDKLINNSPNFGIPSKIEFKLSNFAQKNICKYDNDDDITSDCSGVIVVNNLTLKEKNDCIELPFSQSNASQTDKSCAFIPIYHKINKDDDTEEFEYDNGLTPRILRAEKVYGTVYGNFNKLDWKTILNNKYEGYQSVIKTPRILNVKCKFSNIEMGSIDLSRPVLFSQFGNYYVILKIQSTANGLYDCEFLEIKSYK